MVRGVIFRMDLARASKNIFENKSDLGGWEQLY
jgi:hypothetical protein